jgi:hypothetical protein
MLEPNLQSRRHPGEWSLWSDTKHKNVIRFPLSSAFSRIVIASGNLQGEKEVV